MGVFRQALRDLGYVDGQTIAVEYRYARGRTELYSQLVGELIGLHVDVLVVGSWQPALAAKKVTQTLPIVGVGMGGDPVGIGLVASLARPGGNVTGLSFLTGGAHYAKYLEQLKAAAPKTSHVGFLHEARKPANPWGVVFQNDVQTAAQTLGLTVQVLEVSTLHELDAAIVTMSRQPGGSLAFTAEPLFVAQASQITELAAKYGLPAIYGARVFVDAGGLMSYGPSLADLWRRAAAYVDKILKGAKPGDLPVEQPTKFELLINLKTAKALGLTIPQSLLLRADQVIDP